MSKELSMFQPNGNRVLIRPLTETVSAGGIHIPDSAKGEKVARGIVVKYGLGKVLENGTVDRMEAVTGYTAVYYVRDAAVVKLDSIEYALVSDSYCLGYIQTQQE